MTTDRTVSPFPAASIPASAGVGFKPQHLTEILRSPGHAAWFEVHPENYMGAGGPPHHALSRLRERFPLSMHGVGLSIGADGRLDAEHLTRLREAVRRYQPALVSEHLAWSTHAGVFLNDLLPLPYSLRTLSRVALHVDAAQVAIGRQILIENPSVYVQFAENDFPETEFLRALVRRTGCGLLLDVNNVFVSAQNSGFDPYAYLDAFPAEHVREIHVAGHSPHADDPALLIDTHDRAPLDQIWALAARAIRRAGPVPVLIEWDNDVPAWPVLNAEAAKANRILYGQDAAHAA